MELDFARFRVYLKEKYGVTKAFLFIGFVEGNNDLYVSLQSAGFLCISNRRWNTKTARPKATAMPTCPSRNDRVSHYDKAIIVTGDGDFYCLVQYLIERGNFERVIIPNLFKYSRF